MNITTGDLDPAMILTAIDLSVAQEIPKLSPGEQRGGKDQGQEPSDRISRVLVEHL
jgi:hypothetical protein